MENRQRQLDIPKMPIAYLQWLSTRLAEVRLARDAHTRVERAVLGWEVVARDVEKGAVAYFEDSLLYDVLARALEMSSARVSMLEGHTRAHPRPNRSSFNRFGAWSTSCSFMASGVAITIDAARLSQAGEWYDYMILDQRHGCYSLKFNSCWRA